MIDKPLVSIIVITYNSSKYVLETLESAKAQTYQNIELIISDDCSADNTIEICNKWVKENSQRFSRIDIVTSNHNTGIPANCNRGANSAKGEWVKIIAGDDMLLLNCIETNINFINSTKADLVFSKLRKNYGDKVEETNPNLENKYVRFSNLKSKNQMKLYLSSFFSFSLPAPTFFIKTDVIKAVAGFDERFALYEDRPFIIKTLLNNYKWFFLNEHTIDYNVMETNNSLTNSDFYCNEKLLFNVTKYYHLVLRDILLSNWMFLSFIHINVYFMHIRIVIKNGNKRTNIQIIARLVKLLSPLYVIRKIFSFLK